MKGITEQTFFELCIKLKDSIAEYQTLEDKDEKEENKSTAKMNVMHYVSELINQSSGLIDTNDEEIKEHFNHLYESALFIEKYDQLSSVNKDDIKNNNNADEAAHLLYLNQEIYHSSLKVAYYEANIICERINKVRK